MNNESSDIRNLVVEIRKDILTLVKTDHYDESWRVLECLKDLHVHLDGGRPCGKDVLQDYEAGDEQKGGIKVIST